MELIFNSTAVRENNNISLGILGGTTGLRISGLGNVDVGNDRATGISERVAMSASIAGFVSSVNNTVNSVGGNGLAIRAGSNSAGGTWLLGFFRPDGTSIGSVTQNGTSAVSFNTTSDRRLKKDIQNTASGLETVMKMEVKDYHYIPEGGQDQLHTGFMAQDLYKVFPAAVTVGGEDAKTQPWTIDYSKLSPVLAKAIQEQQTQIEALKAENSELKKMAAKMDKLESLVAALEGRGDSKVAVSLTK